MKIKEFIRVQTKGTPITSESVSYPWGCYGDEDEALDGLSCYEVGDTLYTDSDDREGEAKLLQYWEKRGGVDDELAEVIYFEGIYANPGADGEDLAYFVKEIKRIAYSELKTKLS